MGGLKAIPGRLSSVKARVATLDLSGPDRHRVRDAVQSWRAWYKTQAWRRLRWQVLRDALFTCAACRAVVADTSQLVADHIRPHRGDEALFWDRGNLQCLCKPCHDGGKQRGDGKRGG